MIIFGKKNFRDDMQVDGDLTFSKHSNTDVKKFLTTDADGKVILGTPAGGTGFIEVTYDQFSLALDDAALIPGAWYKMVDYQTCHMIREITATGIVDTTEENLGPIEPLLLFAISPSDYLSRYVFSAVTGDRLVYSVYGGSPSLPGGSVFKGNILRRINDARNISLPMDWQVIKWKMGSQYYQAFNAEYWDEENPDILQPRYGGATNIYIGEAEYNLAVPFLFLYPNFNNQQIHVERPDSTILMYARNIDFYDFRCMDRNVVLRSVKGHTFGTGYVNLISGDSVELKDIVTSGEGAGVYLSASTDTSKYNYGFIWYEQADPYNKYRISVDQATGTVKATVI